MGIIFFAKNSCLFSRNYSSRVILLNHLNRLLLVFLVVFGGAFNSAYKMLMIKYTSAPVRLDIQRGECPFIVSCLISRSI